MKIKFILWNFFLIYTYNEISIFNNQNLKKDIDTQDDNKIKLQKFYRKKKKKINRKFYGIIILIIIIIYFIFRKNNKKKIKNNFLLFFLSTKNLEKKNLEKTKKNFIDYFAQLTINLKEIYSKSGDLNFLETTEKNNIDIKNIALIMRKEKNVEEEIVNFFDQVNFGKIPLDIFNVLISEITKYYHFKKQIHSSISCFIEDPWQKEDLFRLYSNNTRNLADIEKQLIKIPLESNIFLNKKKILKRLEEKNIEDYKSFFFKVFNTYKNLSDYELYALLLNCGYYISSNNNNCENYTDINQIIQTTQDSFLLENLLKKFSEKNKQIIFNINQKIIEIKNQESQNEFSRKKKQILENTIQNIQRENLKQITEKFSIIKMEFIAEQEEQFKIAIIERMKINNRKELNIEEKYEIALKILKNPIKNNKKIKETLEEIKIMENIISKNKKKIQNLIAEQTQIEIPLEDNYKLIINQKVIFFILENNRSITQYLQNPKPNQLQKILDKFISQICKLQEEIIQNKPFLQKEIVSEILLAILESNSFWFNLVRKILLSQNFKDHLTIEKINKIENMEKVGENKSDFLSTIFIEEQKLININDTETIFENLHIIPEYSTDTNIFLFLFIEFLKILKP
jgi:hypothetical protein